MQMSLQIKKIIKRWRFFPVAIFIWNWPKKMFAKGFHSHIHKEKKIQITSSMCECIRDLILVGNPSGRPGINYLGGR